MVWITALNSLAGAPAAIPSLTDNSARSQLARMAAMQQKEISAHRVLDAGAYVVTKETIEIMNLTSEIWHQFRNFLPFSAFFGHFL